MERERERRGADRELGRERQRVTEGRAMECKEVQRTGVVEGSTFARRVCYCEHLSCGRTRVRVACYTNTKYGAQNTNFCKQYSSK